MSESKIGEFVPPDAFDAHAHRYELGHLVDDDPAEAERTLINDGFSGFKAYHLFARREDTFNSDQSEFLPEWARREIVEDLGHP